MMTNDITLFDLNQYFESCKLFGKPCPIVKNYEIRIMATISWGIMGNSTIIRGEAGSAKSILSNNIVKLFYGEKGLKRANPKLFVIDSASDKANIDRTEEARINNAERCYIPELQNVKNHIPTIKKWSEIPPMPYVYKRYGKGTYVLKPLPILTNLADSNEELPELGAELERRLVSLTTMCNEKINEEVHINKARAQYLPDEELRPLKPQRIKMLRKHLRQVVPKYWEGRRVINPYANHIRKIISCKRTISNTVIDYLFDFIKGITLFNVLHRPRTNRYIFSLLEDSLQAYVIAGEMFNFMSVGVNNLAPIIINCIPESVYFGDLEMAPKKGERAHLNQIMDRLDAAGYPRDKNTVKRIMEKLVSSNFVKVDNDGLYYKTSHFSLSKKIDIDLMITEPPAIIKKYYGSDIYKKYKDQKMTFLNPIIGKEQDIKKDVFKEGTQVGNLDDVMDDEKILEEL